MSLSNLRLAAAAAVLAVTAGPAGAMIILSPVPNPIPDGSTWDLVGTFDTPFGVRVTTVSDFSLRDHHPGRIGGDIFRRSLPNGVQYGDGWNAGWTP
jgi:hypothetical protein